jgi:hypothetical protein
MTKNQLLSPASPSPLTTRGRQTLAVATPSLLLPSPHRRRRAPPQHNPDGPLGWRRRGVSLQTVVAQWSSSAECVDVPLSTSLATVTGRSVVSPSIRPTSVDGGHLPWSGGASIAVGGRSVGVVVEDRSVRLPQGRSGKRLAWCRPPLRAVTPMVGEMAS